MVKIIVAFTDATRCAQYAAVLEESGLEVYRRCSSGGEALRALNQCQDGVIVCGARLKDFTADELAYDAEGRAQVLVAAKAEQLSLCEHPSIFRLPAPFSRGELVSAVNMLLQLHKMRLPQRGADEKKLIEEAKRRLMTLYGVDEPEAHRLLQRASMNAGVKLAQSARKVLEGVDMP